MLIGPGWIPDLVEAEADGDWTSCTITLVELEGSEITARASCRKYIPESSIEIVQRFLSYLESVLAQCKATADPRLGALRSFREALVGGLPTIVRTAGALRSSSEFLEVHALRDQPEQLSTISSPATVDGHSFEFEGMRSFSREETDGLRRAVRILHAVVTGNDHSNATLHSWGNLRRKPLEVAASKYGPRLTQLGQLLNNRSASGMQIDSGKLVDELVELWSNAPTFRLSRAGVAEALRTFTPISMRFAGRDSMRAVFAAARSVLEMKGI